MREERVQGSVKELDRCVALFRDLGIEWEVDDDVSEVRDRARMANVLVMACGGVLVFDPMGRFLGSMTDEGIGWTPRQGGDDAACPAPCETNGQPYRVRRQGLEWLATPAALQRNEVDDAE